MAIQSIAKSLKLRLPRRLRSKKDVPVDSSPEPTVHVENNDAREVTVPKFPTKEDTFRHVFQFLDKNNDGRISAGELSAYFTSVGESVSNEAAEKIIREYTKNRIEAGEEDLLLLEFDEFVRIMEVREGGDVDDDDKVLREAFKVYEVEKGSGVITAEGLRQVLSRLGDAKTCKECEAMIRVFDLDGNGVLDFQEFRKMMA